MTEELKQQIQKEYEKLPFPQDEDAGETLEKLAEKYSITYDELVKLIEW